MLMETSLTKTRKLMQHSHLSPEVLKQLSAVLSPDQLSKLSTPQLQATQARTRWLTQARRNQLTPSGAWSVWLMLAGRGFGKTRAGAEDVAWYSQLVQGSRTAIVAPTYSDARDTCVEGESG